MSILYRYSCQESKAISIIRFLWVAELLKCRDVLWPCTKVQLLTPAVRQARTRDLPNSEQNSLAATGKDFTKPDPRVKLSVLVACCWNLSIVPSEIRDSLVS